MAPEEVRTGLSVEAFRRSILDNLFYVQGRFPAVATRNDWYMAVALSVRDRVLQRWGATGETYSRRQSRTVCYLSAEFLLGPHLGNTLLNLGVEREVRQAVAELGLDFDALLDQEEEPGLGNGGLGRLAACFMDSLATLQVPAIGYGIRYEFGIFDQEIRDGWQVERTDKWLRLGNPWEIARPEIAFEVKLGGHTEPYTDERGRYRVRWVPERVVKGVAYDTPILGYRVNTANLLRLWKAEAVESFDFEAFNIGDYYGAVDEKIFSETISKVLYPNDEPGLGKMLRLAQQYFFVSCSLQDMIRILFQADARIEGFADKYAIQLNDTHPSLAVAELMRLLVDEHGLDWEPAWDITRRTLAYTNHTLLPEALEKWTVELFGRVLPRHLEIVYEINRRFLDEVRTRYPGDEARVARLSLIDETGPRYVRMAHLACVGSHAINGVAALHTELLERDTLRDFFELSPEKFSNKTNGVTPRRFLALINPRLAALITEAIGEGWLKDLERLRALEPFAEDAAFRARWRGVKADNKRALARVHPGADRTGGRSGKPVRRADQAHPRVQAPAPERPSRRRCVPAAQAACSGRGGAAHRALRGQGRARLLHGQAHHQADQLGRGGGQRRPRRARSAEGGVLPRLQRQAQPADLPGRGSVRADLHGRQGGLRHRQHEAGDERRAHHRHAGRRQHRDPRRGGRGELLPVRAHGRGGRRAESARLPPARLLRRQSAPARGDRPHRRAVTSRAGTAICSAR